VLLALAGFASQAQVRVTDSLLPQIAADFDASVGAAAIVVTAYAVAHGSTQLLIGPLGDRFGKYLTITLTAAVSAILVMICGLAQSLPALAIARLLAGAAAGWVIPLSMAYVGDVTPTSAGSLLAPSVGQIFGQLFGRPGGVLGDCSAAKCLPLGGLFALPRRPRVRAHHQSSGACAVAGGNLARFRRRLCGRALQSVGAHRHFRGDD
jgi:MFS family permease